MGQQSSRDESLHRQVNCGNSDRIVALVREGAGLEGVDREGKTPLIVACMNPELLNVAKTLIELGANVNAYRRGSHAGTPLHHAAENGLDQTVKLLLSHRANVLVMNDDGQSPLDVARVKGYSNVVNTIESHICLFSGWLRELYGPRILEVLVPQWMSTKIWVVVVPCASHKFKKRLKFELAIYPSSQHAKPRTVIALWKAKIKEPKFRRADPALIIFDKSTKTRYKLASENEGDKQQLQWLYNACKGISPVMRPPLPHNIRNPVVSVTAPPSIAEDVNLAMANDWDNSVDNTSPNGWGPAGRPLPVPPSKVSSSGWLDESGMAPEPGSSGNPTRHVQSQHNTNVAPTTHKIPITASSIPSAPPISEVVVDGPIYYPSIASSSIDLSTPSVEKIPARTSEVKENGGTSSSCVICLDAPIEGACVPCGHMVGCMSCLNEIKAKKWGCPVCRAMINQVMKIYAV